MKLRSLPERARDERVAAMLERYVRKNQASLPLVMRSGAPLLRTDADERRS